MKVGAKGQRGRRQEMSAEKTEVSRTEGLRLLQHLSAESKSLSFQYDEANISYA